MSRQYVLPNNTTKAGLSFTTSGDNQIIAGVANKTWKIYRLKLRFTSAATVIFKSGSTVLATFPAITALDYDFLAPEDGEYYKSAAAGDAFTINLSGTIVSGGSIEYRQDNEATQGLGYT